MSDHYRDGGLEETTRVNDLLRNRNPRWPDQTNGNQDLMITEVSGSPSFCLAPFAARNP